MSLIEARSICKTFNGRSGEHIPAVDQLSLDIQDEEFVVIVGPSGCGKSTFLQMVGGLEKPTAGTLRIEDQSVDGPDARCGLVFQEYLLFPWKTVQGNIAFGPSLRGLSKGEIESLCAHYIELVGLQNFASSYPHELSGGMKQRVAIARALANQPRVLLMDEPFGALDALTRESMQWELLRIWEDARCTVVFVTHSITEAVLLADRVIVMSKRPGRIKKDIAIDLPRPRTRQLSASTEFLKYESTLKQLVWEEV
ncbi:MAG: ABC transporter ATP-binding protein [Desulfofustis sp.]|jgi:NitT/TauT family transport system ATP-binding protein|nr:ABC transporter ATP-binding protein [Desulfofustis sp.]